MIGKTKVMAKKSLRFPRLREEGWDVFCFGGLFM